MKKFLFVIFTLILAFSVRAKELERFMVRGYVTMADTSEWVTLDSVHVSISVANDTVSVPFKILAGDDATRTLDTDGEIRLMVYAGRGNYVLTLDRDGYQPRLKDFKVTSLSQDIVWLGAVDMRRERVRRLNEVEVVATAIKMVVKGDTLVYNADAFNLAEGSMLDALVRQLPGAELSADGQIKVNGKFVSSLLVNGKDFFKGDPQVALQNLPAYTVKNVKVYDKAADDDYLTHASAKLSRREDEENIVMDVVLKKEYSTGYMVSAEAGYGTDNRYLGKLFGMMFTDNLKVGVFANSNNVNNTEEGNLWGSGGFGSGWTPSGTLRLHMGGLNYNFNDSKRWRADGNVVYSHENYDERSESSSTRFYPGSPDLYGRSDSRKKDLRRHLRSSHNIMYQGDNVFLSVSPGIDWLKTDVDKVNREATFNEPPVETSRVESLDSVFARPFSERYDRYMLSRLMTTSMSNPGWTDVYLRSRAHVAPSNMRGSFIVMVNGSFKNDWNDSRILQLQHFGGANTSGATPLSTDRYVATIARRRSLDGQINYSHDWRHMDEKMSRTVSLETSVYQGHNYNSNVVDQFNSPEGADLSGVLPSLSRPIDYLINRQNSYDSRTTTNTTTATAYVRFSLEPVAPVDTGFNPAVSLRIGATDRFVHTRLHYLGIAEETVVRRDNILSPSVNVQFSSGDKRRYTYGYLYYGYSASPVSANLFLTVRNTSDPLHIYVNNASGLKNASSHNTYLYIGTYDRSQRQMNAGLRVEYSRQHNAIGQAALYNEQTGVTTYTPRNINGNWNTSADGNFSFSFGPGYAFNMGVNPGFSYDNSVDFITMKTEPERSEVRTRRYDGSIYMGYKFSNGSSVELTGKANYRQSRSDRSDFRPINAGSYGGRLEGVAILPLDIRFNTSLEMELTRGYEVAAMNTTQWLWNAGISKSILKGNLLFKLEAFDILGQVKPYRINVNAQGRYETWSNTLPRYVMLSVSYRIHHNPKKKQHD